MGVMVLSLSEGMALTDPNSPKTPNTETIYIPTDNPPPASADDYSHPFFAAPSTGNEVMEEMEAHKGEFEKLKEEVNTLKQEVKMLKEEVDKLKSQAKLAV